MKKILFITLITLNSMLFAFTTENKVVIQVSTDDKRTQVIALNNIANLHKEYGDDIQIELVAYGPGISILSKKSDLSNRVESMAINENIGFSACGNTLDSIKNRTGKDLKLSQGVMVTKGGVSRIMKLQQQGYSYIRP